MIATCNSSVSTLNSLSGNGESLHSTPLASDCCTPGQGLSSCATVKTSLVGQVFGRLTVLSESTAAKGSGRFWLCQCSCGNQCHRSTGKLRDKQSLSGNDFLPIAVKLDDLLSHLAIQGEVVTRLREWRTLNGVSGPPATDVTQRSVTLTGTTIRQPRIPASEADAVSLAGPVSETQRAKRLSDLSQESLEEMAQFLADMYSKRVSLVCIGLEEVPAGYRRMVEKILGRHEDLRPDWDVYGTTGYDALNLLNGLFVVPSNRQPFHNLYARFTGQNQSFSDLTYECKKLILGVAMSSELHVLARRLDRISNSIVTRAISPLTASKTRSAK